MALIDFRDRYIKLEKNGIYKVYSSEAARKRVKAATPAETILAKYRELIENFYKPEQDEFKYYDPEGFAAIYNPLYNEYLKYQYNFKHFVVGEEYPIMVEYYPDVVDSIPEIVEAARIPHEYKDVEEAYIVAKQLKRFGETTDA